MTSPPGIHPLLALTFYYVRPFLNQAELSHSPITSDNGLCRTRYSEMGSLMAGRGAVVSAVAALGTLVTSILALRKSVSNPMF